jgi:dipeptidyl aminopeptidase/acylaminoacyl peptidase
LEELRDDGPSRFHLYERSQKNLRHLMDQRKELAGKALPSSRPVEIISRDGLKLVSYLILPAKEKGAVPAKPLPMVLDAHEGPWRRNFKAFHPFRQLLADRGYAVLAVNYRGSTGFGKKFVAAGNLEWGRKMNEDLADAVQWAVKEKIADPARVAVLGFSYGGYATLAALAFTPDLFACGIDMSGPCDLNSLLENAPDYWAATWMQIYHSRMGDPSTPEGKKLLQDRSPALHVDGIKKPLLIAQGANDPKVMRSDTDKFVKALKEKGVPVTYALYPDEGQGFHRPENNLAFMALAEAFLKKHLGGEAEPIGKSFEGSSLRILEGKEGIPGL